MVIKSPFKIKAVLFRREYPGYIYRRELIDDSEYGGNGDLVMVNCYSSDSGHWIGDAKTARFLCTKLRLVHKADDRHCVSSIGFCDHEQKWYGWSHRAICGFGIGDRIFEERYGDEHTPFTQHGRRKITHLNEAMQSAINFAGSVS